MYDPRFILNTFDSLAPEAKVTILYGLLDSLILADMLWFKANPRCPGVYDTPLVYQAEEIGRDDWRDIPSVLEHKGGDCEDLGCYRVAELRFRHGEPAQPYVTSKLVKSKRYGTFTLYHIRVKRADGSIEDPSKILGMP